MEFIAVILSLVLFVIAALHLYWALGGLWPGIDKASLTRTVIGATNMSTMPPAWLTVAVSACIFAASLFPLMWENLMPDLLPKVILLLGMWVLSLVFIGRGIAGYQPFFRKSNSEEPFASLNRKYFSPLCLLLGGGFISLVLFSGTRT
ncbi:MAG: DUF3995 domain-containing protein [Rhizobiaceae bacterium]|nr:DUF3995 domain-containing protein [Rhizobiaceae bacterium]